MGEEKIGEPNNGDNLITRATTMSYVGKTVTIAHDTILNRRETKSFWYRSSSNKSIYFSMIASNKTYYVG